MKEEPVATKESGAECSSRRLATARRQNWRAAASAAICGYVNAYAVLHYGVYASFMTGNTASAGIRATQKQFSIAVRNLLPIPFFMLGILAATFLAHADERSALQRISALVGVTLLLDVAAFYTRCPEWLVMAILCAAMGVVNTSITNVGGQSVSSGFVTGDLASLAKALASGIERDPPENAQGSWDPLGAGPPCSPVSGLLSPCGVLSGAVLVRRSSAWSLVFPAITLQGFACCEHVMDSDR